MTPGGARRWRQTRLAAVFLMVAIPAGAFVLAPTPHARADSGTPGANLGGVDAASTATGIDIAPLTPGIVGAGDVSQGNLIEAAAPYASASINTGPISQAVGAPFYPGATAAGAGNALGTFASQLPPQLLSALNDSALAQADYPPQPSAGSSATYAPPTGSAAGVGTANASASDSGSQANGATTDNAFPGSVISFGSSTTNSSTELGDSSVTATAETDVNSITLLNGQIVIDGIKSTATASSDGNTGTPTSTFGISSVTVAGQAASIGPNGIQLANQSQGGILPPTANAVLSALKQAGISVTTISPQSTTSGATASVQSGALLIQFFDSNVPNPGGQVPVSAAGLNIYVGLSQASADATSLSAVNFGNLGDLGSLGGTPSGGGSGGSVGNLASTPSGSSGSAGFTSGASTSQVPVVNSPAPAISQAPSTGSSISGASVAPAASSPSASSTSPTTQPASQLPLSLQQAATVFGKPIKVSWVIIAFLLSLVVAGPLLGYANWQLLKGRRS